MQGTANDKRCQRGSMKDLISQKKNWINYKKAKLIPREKGLETPTRPESIEQDRNSGQLFRPCWDSSALCSEDM